MFTGFKPSKRRLNCSRMKESLESIEKWLVWIPLKTKVKRTKARITVVIIISERLYEKPVRNVSAFDYKELSYQNLTF
jgi:hypothetical protein